MDRINAPGGVFVPTTKVTSVFLNTLQQEIANVIEGAGLTLDSNDQGQLEEAITAMIAVATGGDVIDFTIEDSGATIRLNQKVTGGYIKYAIISGNSHTFTAADCGRYLIFTNNAAVTATCPQNSTEDLGEGWNCITRYNGTSSLTFVTEGSDSLAGDGAVMDSQGAEVVIDLQTAGTPNTYFIKGDAS